MKGEQGERGPPGLPGTLRDEEYVLPERGPAGPPVSIIISPVTSSADRYIFPVLAV